jgi:hypothetical protein
VSDICEYSTTESYEEDNKVHPMERFDPPTFVLSYFKLMDQYNEMKAENEKLKLEVNQFKRREEQREQSVFKKIKMSGAMGTKFMKG